jgi:hypothetical protein
MGRPAVVKRLIDIESREKERLDSIQSPLGSNKVKYNTAYYGRQVEGPAYKWCVVFQWWCFQKAGIPTSIFPKTAAVFTVRDWFKHPSRNRYFPPSTMPIPGDLVIFKYSHIGLVEAVHADGRISVLEGNKSDRVMRVTHRRTDTDIDGYCRPEYHKVEEDDFMALFDNVNEFKAAVREILRDELRTVIRGDDNTDDGGTHPHNLRNIHNKVEEIKRKVEQ